MAYSPRPPLGQATMANSEPVVLASDQSAIAVTATLVAGGDVDVLTVPAPLNLVGGGVEAAALRVTIANDSTGVLSIDDNGGSITIDGTVTVTGVATETTLSSLLTSSQLMDDSVLTDNAAFTDGTTKVIMSGFIFDEVAGTALTENDAAAARIDAKRAIVNVIEDATTRGQRMIVTTRGSTLVEGDLAHDAVDAGNPVKVGGVAVSGSTIPTPVVSGDRTRWIFNNHGVPYTIAGHPNLITREYDFGASAQTDVNLAAAAVAADERIYVTRFEATCDMANTANVTVRAGFGATSVPTASATGVSGMISSHPGLAPGSGIVSGTGAGLIAIGGAGEEPRLTSSAATSGNLHVIISYYLIDETP